MRALLDSRRDHQQAPDDRRAEVPGRGHETARKAAGRRQTLRQTARIGIIVIDVT